MKQFGYLFAAILIAGIALVAGGSDTTHAECVLNGGTITCDGVDFEGTGASDEMLVEFLTTVSKPIGLERSATTSAPGTRSALRSALYSESLGSSHLCGQRITIASPASTSVADLLIAENWRHRRAKTPPAAAGLA